jgi:hypothetical protein
MITQGYVVLTPTASRGPTGTKRCPCVPDWLWKLTQAAVDGCCSHCLRKFEQHETPFGQTFAYACATGTKAAADSGRVHMLAVELHSQCTADFTKALERVKRNDMIDRLPFTCDALMNQLPKSYLKQIQTDCLARHVYTGRQCAWCKSWEQRNRGCKTSRCSGCNVVRYCDAECQLLDWEAGHRKQCASIK